MDVYGVGVPISIGVGQVGNARFYLDTQFFHQTGQASTNTGADFNPTANRNLECAGIDGNPLFILGDNLQATSTVQRYRETGGSIGATAVIPLGPRAVMGTGGGYGYTRQEYESETTFDFDAIRLINEYDTRTNLNEIYGEAWFRLFLGTKDYLVVNTFMLTAGVGLNGALQFASVDARATQTQTQNFGNTQATGSIYVLAEPIDLIPQQNFRAEINFPVVLAVPDGVAITVEGFAGRQDVFSADPANNAVRGRDVNYGGIRARVDLGVYLDGFFKREVH